MGPNPPLRIVTHLLLILPMPLDRDVPADCTPPGTFSESDDSTQPASALVSYSPQLHAQIGPARP